MLFHLMLLRQDLWLNLDHSTCLRSASLQPPSAGITGVHCGSEQVVYMLFSVSAGCLSTSSWSPCRCLPAELSNQPENYFFIFDFFMFSLFSSVFQRSYKWVGFNLDPDVNSRLHLVDRFVSQY